MDNADYLHKLHESVVKPSLKRELDKITNEDHLSKLIRDEIMWLHFQGIL